MVTQIEAFNYYRNLYLNKAIYVWGMNAPTLITEDTIKQCYKQHGTSTYDWDYYLRKLQNGLNHVGSDCSGAHCGISGYDTTAQGYYNKCTKTGKIKTLPKNQVVLLFYSSNGSSKNITHTGVYLGDGTCFHMASSKRNAVLEDVNIHGWQFWGYADFISYDTAPIIPFYKAWVKDLQTILNTNFKAKLIVDGIFGAKTLNALMDIGNIKKGVKSPIVTSLQKFLNYVNNTELATDGIFGDKTKLGVVMFQKNNGLTADGIVGKKTWQKIQKRCNV